MLATHDQESREKARVSILSSSSRLFPPPSHDLKPFQLFHPTVPITPQEHEARDQAFKTRAFEGHLRSIPQQVIAPCLRPVIPASRRQRQEDYTMFKASQVHRVRSSLKTTQQDTLPRLVAQLPGFPVTSIYQFPLFGWDDEPSPFPLCLPLFSDLVLQLLLVTKFCVNHNPQIVR